MMLRSKCFPFALVLAAVAAIAPPAAAEPLAAVQYFHKTYEHYFVTANRAEVDALDRGTIAGWWRTGTRYRVETASGADLHPVCRFHTAAFASRSSHFFTAFKDECEAVKANSSWTYEGIAFYARLPAGGACAAGTAPVYRLYNDGMTGAPNHAYLVDPRQRNRLLDAGWIDEGLAFCATMSTADAVAESSKLAGSTWAFPDPPSYFGPGTIITTFGTGIRTDAAATEDSRVVGMPRLPAVVTHAANGAWAGAGGFDPWSATFVVAGASGFEGGSVAGIVWELADAEGASTPVCSMLRLYNFTAGDGFTTPLHRYQPYLWGPCEPGVATKT